MCSGNPVVPPSYCHHYHVEVRCWCASALRVRKSTNKRIVAPSGTTGFGTHFEMMEAVDKLIHYRSDMLQAVPASWSDPQQQHPHQQHQQQHPQQHQQHQQQHQQQHGGVPATTMEFAYDGVYSAVTPYYHTAFPSTVLTQTLYELDIDTSIHKLFEGLPEILEDRDGESVLARPGVTVAAPAPFFPSTPPAQQGSRPSGEDVIFMAPHNAAPAILAPAASRVARARKGRAPGPARRRDAKVPGGARASHKVLDAIVPSISVAAPSQAHGVCMVAKILPVTTMDLCAVKTTSEAVASVGVGAQAVLPMPKRSRIDPPPLMANTRTQKTRYFDKVEHIVRERWRRDDMAGKFLALESLLPPSSKRDRSTIVEDSMKLVKSLQHRKEEAQKRRAELKLAAQSPGVKLNRIIQKIGSLAVIPVHGSGGAHESPSSSSMVLSAGAKRPLDQDDTDQQQQQISPALSNCVKRFYVHSELCSGDIVIEMICEHIPHFHSVLLKSIESLGLEVIRCSVTKTINKFICNTTVKPFATSVNLSSTSIMEGLSSAFLKE